MDREPGHNMTTDGLRGFTVRYNLLNLPATIKKSTDSISYIYAATGEKLAKRMKDNSYQYYAGNMVYNSSKALDYILFEEGMVRNTSGSYTYEYYLKDHLGNTRVVFKQNTLKVDSLQVTDYYPFGSTFNPTDPNNGNKYLYNGKEKQDDVLGSTALDWYDYGWRMYDPQIARWHCIDKLAEKYYNISPYVYCANNPIMFIDPDGRQIDPANQDEYDRMQRQVERKHDRLDNKLQRLQNRGASQNKIARVQERVNQLAQTVNNLNTLEASPVMYQLNSLDPATNSQGYLSYNANGNNGNGAVVINYIKGSTSNFVHESTHAGQFETRDIAFPSANAGANTIGVDLFDEVAAYKAQYAFSPSSVTGLQSNVQVNNINGITSNWVQNIFDPVTNTHPYQAQHVGIVPVNTGTTVNTLIQAYPTVNFGGINRNTTLRQLYPNIVER